MAASKNSADSLLGTVLVTGGCGFIGSFIVEAFAASSSCSSVVAASRNPTKFCIAEATYKVCNFSDRNQVTALLNEVKPRVIVHTVSPGPFATPDEHYRISYLATKQLLELAKQHPSVRALVWTSSMNAVKLDPAMNSSPLTESGTELNDFKSKASAYGRAKGATETIILASNTDASTVDFSGDASWEGKLLTTSLRITGLYGPRDKTTIWEILKVVNTMATRIQIGKNELLHEWNYVESAANAHVLAARALLDGQHLRPDMRVDGEAFSITDGSPMKFWDFSRKVWEMAGDEFCNRRDKEMKLIVIPFWFMKMVAGFGEWACWLFTFGRKRPRMTVDHFEFMSSGCWFSIEKAQTRLGYEPVCDTEEGIRRTIKWFKDNEGWEKG
ncbi:C-3 sterol dehydrogenase/C-4 decarboxylase-like protein [Zopfia rhizophila CBS 207.26]|uniref:C-3 sterol dehydrogenase/C-4 decarboxylase-like protein n=1 Tax=Zopfia rhizophila CBS 207.26 TaxID=1314779 RepID=A0A6A6EM97_9PEZI|nr:C-3 sterol dehydrogenase/C-4 decarboxylase-like protein [Zopfia rhizophila CBS 207.26]